MKLVAALLFFFSLSLPAFATWSIILIDAKTGKIGIAGASCTYNCYGIGRIVPGKGAIIVQAMSNHEARQKGLEMIRAGFTPKEIVAALKKPEFDFEQQQYAVVTLNHLSAPATYTGSETHASKGTLTANGVSVQGNTLVSEQELQAILNTVLKGQRESLRIEEILMRALEAGAETGGDKRCGEQRASSAFLMVAQPGDHPNRLSLNLQIFGQPKGGPNAVSLLRKKYERWKK
ncbi:hypothetical protein GCM10027347_47650 [Larkinella harenae]